MKILYLLRHAKSEDPALFLSDFKRSLKGRGERDIVRIAEKWKTLQLPIDLVLCSDAVRTTETFKLFSKTIQYKGPYEYIHALYHASASEILECILEKGKNAENILVVGHNFGISQLAEYLCANGCEELPTSGMAIIAFENEIEMTRGKLLHCLIPKAI